MTPHTIRPIVAAALTAMLAGPPAAHALPDSACADRTVRLPHAAGTSDALRVVQTWLDAWPPAERDRVLLSERAIARLNAHNGTRPAAHQDVVLGPRRRQAHVDAELAERRAYFWGRLTTPEGMVEDRPGAYAAAERRMERAARVDTLHAVVHPAALRCVPMASGIFTRPIDRDFDRNQCARLHPGEVVRASRVSADGWWYVHTGHSVGWLQRPSLTPPLSADSAAAFRGRGDRLVAVDDWIPTSTGVFLRMGAHVPRLGQTADGAFWHVLLPSEDGLVDAFIATSPAVHAGFQPLTRARVLQTVFARLGDAYGWGGTGGGRDCSRLMLDTFSTFGLALGRNSSVQARSGAIEVDVRDMSVPERRAAIRDAGRRGVVFLYMQGHIMLYLGELDGTPYAISAISEYLEPCPEGGHTTVRLDKVEVTNLELGRGTDRTAFIERIATLAVFGPGPAP